MAVTAKFQADFSSFLSAIDKAQLELVDFGKGAEKVEGQLNRMVDNFSGRKLIQEASLMTIAVEKAGGVATLTGTQLEQVGNKANDAADKLKKLGYDVPIGLQKLADETKNANTHFAEMKDIASSMAGLFAGVFSVTAVVSFGKELFAAADNLVKLSDKTGVGVEALQKFQIVGDDAGNTVDQITSAITKLENKLVGGDAKALDALGKLGIAFEDIKTLTPENQFIAISDAIRKIDDPAQQVNIAMALFGKAGAEILPTLKKGFDDVKDGAVGMSKETVKAWDDAGDAIQRWWRITKGNTAEALVFLGRLVADGLDPNVIAAHNLERQAEATAIQLGEMAKQARAALPPMQKLVPDDMAAKLAELNFDLDKSNQEMVKAADAANKAAEAQAKYRNEVLKSTPADKDQVVVLESLLEGLVVGTDAYNNVRDAIGGMLAKGLVVPDMLKNWYDANKPVLTVSKDFSGVMATMPNVLSDTADSLHNLAGAANDFHDGITVANNTVGTVTIPLFTTLTKGVLPQMSKEIQDAGDDIEKSFGDRASDTLGGMVKILHQVHDTFSEVAATAAQGAKTMIDSWKNTHSVFDLVVNAATTAIGLISKLFTDAEKQINPVREAFVQLNGGLDALNKKAFDAGTTLTALLNAKNPEQYQKAIDDLNKAFADQKAKVDTDTGALGDLLKQAQGLGGTLPKALQDSIQKLIDMGKVTGDTKDLLASLSGSTTVTFGTMRDIAQKYGVDLNNLGPKFEAAKIGDTAQGIINDFDTLQRGLGDTDEALRIMRKPINDLVNDSLKFGVDIPANMKPWVDQLLLTGQLTDVNGDKITDISKIKFSDPIATQFQTLIDKISALIDKISGPNGLTAGINAIPAKKTTEIETVLTTRHVDDGGGGPAMAARGGIVTTGGVQYLAGGGRVLPWPSRGSDTVPAMLTPGEGIVSRRGMASLGRAGLAAINRGGGMGGSGVMVVNNFSIAADIDSPASRERFRKAVDDATMAALSRQKRFQVA